MGPDFDPAWNAIAPSLVTVTAAAQLAAARTATEYVPAVLAETDQPDEPEARVRPQSFAGRASDGRSLPGLLSGAVVAAKRASEDRIEITEVDGGEIRTRLPGLAPQAALAVGGRWLDGTLRTIVTDAARDAAQVETFVRPKMGYVRQVNPPCCSRCAVLAGKWYRSNDILPRHKSCDCSLIPSLENRAGDFTTDPQLLVDRGLVTDLTKGQRERLADGADLPKVLNESRDRWRERMAADRRARGPVDRAGRSRPSNWGGGDGKPLIPPGGTVHDLMANLTADVERRRAVDALRGAGIVS